MDETQLLEESEESCQHKEWRAFGRRHRECTDCGHIWEPDDEDEPEDEQP